MLANLMRPFLLVRLTLAAVATMACVIGLVTAYRYVRAEAHPLGHPARIEGELAQPPPPTEQVIIRAVAARC